MEEQSKQSPTPPRKMCPHCGAENTGTQESIYCTDCGRAVSPTQWRYATDKKICPNCGADNPMETTSIYCTGCAIAVSQNQWLYNNEEFRKSVLIKASGAAAQSKGISQKGFRQVPDAFDVGYVTETGLVWDKYSIVWILITAVIGFASISAISEQNFEGFLVGLVITVISGLYARYLIQGGRFRIIFF